jgi:hypothetical protein
MLFYSGVLPYLTGPSFNMLYIRLHPRPSAAFEAELRMGHAALALMDVGVGFVDRPQMFVQYFTGLFFSGKEPNPLG